MSRTPPGRTRERVWRFVTSRILAGEPPTVREVQEAVGLSSSSAAIYHLDALVEEGRLSKGAGGETRSFRLPAARRVGSRAGAVGGPLGSSAGASGHASAGIPIAVPILGRVQAGALTSAHQDTEGFVSVQSRFAPEDLFALRVRGDSMAPDIQPDDLVIVRRQPTADDGEIVVALVGDEATVKQLSRKRGRVELVALNPSYAPIVPGEDPEGNQELVVLGKVIELRRSLGHSGSSPRSSPGSSPGSSSAQPSAPTRYSAERYDSERYYGGQRGRSQRGRGEEPGESSQGRRAASFRLGGAESSESGGEAKSRSGGEANSRSGGEANSRSGGEANSRSGGEANSPRRG